MKANSRYEVTIYGNDIDISPRIDKILTEAFERDEAITSVDVELIETIEEVE